MIRLGAMAQGAVANFLDLTAAFILSLGHVVVVSREVTNQISVKTVANPVDALAFGVKMASLVSDADSFISNVRRKLPSLFLGKTWLPQ